ncbi:MAG: porin [Chitinophagales bacterium]
MRPKFIFSISILLLCYISLQAQNFTTNKNPHDSIYFSNLIKNIFVYEQPGLKNDTSGNNNINKKVKISGGIQVHYLNEFNTNGDTIRDPDGFRVLRARLRASGNINKYIGYELMIDPRSPEHGGLLRDAYIELNVIKNQSIRVGQQKTQFGWENRESAFELYTINRAEVSDGISRGENLRDIGIGLIGNIPINDKIRFENAITFTNGTKMNINGPFDFNTKKALWGRVGLRYKSDLLTIRLGGSFGYGGLRYLGDTLNIPTDDIYVDFKRIGADLEIDHDYFFFASEFGKGTDENDTIFEEPVGYQVLLALKTKYKIGPLVRYDAFEDEFKQLTIGAYYGLPKDKFRIVSNYIFRGGIKDIPGGHDDRFYIQLQIVFG